MTDLADPHEIAAPGDPVGAPNETHGTSHVTSTGISNEKLAMWVFLGSECLLFGGLISTFLLYKERTASGPKLHDLFDIGFTSISSFVLLISSLTMVLAVSAIQRGDHRSLRSWLAVTALLGSVFISGQVYEFKEFLNEGMGFTTSPASSAFFTLTGFHGAHVTIGIIMLISTLVLSLRGRITQEKAEAVEIVGLYWHFVDVVWIIVFTVVYLIK
ncbi:cytochrome c oxidase subunit 3 [Aquihabitans sp. G128]|uniref:cytochrome c oxidase subunit 3 n=1 Tax=Aquihabitans sp. G128 TaxID=2849779 RepID=UPI0020B1795B|nr:cytochrome c oxidase subunit 3 [Aquihabitans sp. G128]